MKLRNSFEPKQQGSHVRVRDGIRSSFDQGFESDIHSWGVRPRNGKYMSLGKKKIVLKIIGNTTVVIQI